MEAEGQIEIEIFQGCGFVNFNFICTSALPGSLQIVPAMKWKFNSEEVCHYHKSQLTFLGDKWEGKVRKGEEKLREMHHLRRKLKGKVGGGNAPVRIDSKGK